jgi:vacuolar-type H+-ATPase subunit E/Vma4
MASFQAFRSVVRRIIMAAEQEVSEILKFLIGRYDRNSVPIDKALHDIGEQVQAIVQGQAEMLAAITNISSGSTGQVDLTPITHQLEELKMAFNDKVTELSGKLDAMNTQAQKAYGEIVKALEDAKASQITKEEFDKAVAAAKEAQKTDDTAAMDAALAPLGEKIDASTASIQKLDDIVADAEPTPVPTPEPTPVPEPTPTPVPPVVTPTEPTV